jgi:fatty acid desaturase
LKVSAKCKVESKLKVRAAEPRAIDDAIHAIPIEWFKPAPAVYWLDLFTSAAVGWATLVLAVLAHGWRRSAFLLVAIVALYRAVLFIHEITHRAGRDVPAFTFVWNTLVGVPLLLPSFLYEGVHTDHHRPNCYGTEADPEYVPFGRRAPALILGSVVVSWLAPVALAFRFGILAPLAWVIPALRRPVFERCSALCINHRYVRRVPLTFAAHVQEAAACAVFWISVALWWTGWLPAGAFLCWLVASGAVSGINAVRTLAAHRYDVDTGELSMTEQLLDSCTIASGDRLRARLTDVGRALVAPVGLRYHALHHWIPSLPYHNLGRVHRLLVSTLRADSPYRATIEPGFTPPLRDLVRRSRAARPDDRR